MNDLNIIWNEFLEKCQSYKNQQENYRESLMIDGITSVRQPCCPRMQSDCFKDYYKNRENWECVLCSYNVYCNNGTQKNDYVSREYISKACEERGIKLD